MEKTVVIHIITKMELGGAQQNTLYTVTHLDGSRFVPYLVTGCGGELFEEASRICKNLHSVPSLVREIRPLKDIKAFFSVSAVLRSIKKRHGASAVYIVHTHSSKAGILGRWAARFAGIPLVVHSFHGFGFHPCQPVLLRWFYIFLERITALATSRFIAVSHANRDCAARLGICPYERSVVIRSGIDRERFSRCEHERKKTRRDLGIPDNAPLVTMISCLKPQKAPVDFVKAASIVREEIPEVHFLQVGDGCLRPAVEHAVKDSGLSSCFHLAGWRRDIPELIHATDIVVLTSLWEGLPRAVLQAMAAGVPVIATAVDGTPEAVKDGVNGFTVAPHDVRALAEKVMFLLENPVQAHEMGKQGSVLAAEFDICRMMTDQEALYRELSGAPGPE
jgi:glycosyltransferase involved in cell wall biosynthesis